MRKVLKIIIPCMLLTLPFFSVNNSDKKATPVCAVDDQITDMSSIALLDGEAIDTNNIIYDDFSNGNLNQNWTISHRKWGGYDNKGVSAENVYLDTKDNKLIIRAVGNQNLSTKTVNGVGGPLSAGAVVLKQAARPGRYEVKMKPAYRVGVCNAFWTYTEDGKGNNHEIDIEFPFKDSSYNNSYDEVIFTNYIGESNFQQTHTTLDYYLNDGEYHTFAFDWYYSASHKVINYYIDSQLLATHTVKSQLPFLASKLWLGCWIPNNPGFVGIPNFDLCYMEIDYFKYSPFLNQDQASQGNGGGAGNSVSGYNQMSGLPTYEWLSDGNFNSASKNTSLEDRGYVVDGTARIYSGYDRLGSTSSGGLKLNPNSSISYKVDSTYKDFEYKLSLNYIGKAKIEAEFYSNKNQLISTAIMETSEINSWNAFKDTFQVPNRGFYTNIKIINTSSEDLFLDDLSLVLSDGEVGPPDDNQPVDPPVNPPVEPEKIKIQTLSIDQREIEIEANKTFTLTAIYSPEDVDEIQLVWGSEDASVATISGGVVKGVKEGTTRVVVIDLVTNLSAYCTIKVTPGKSSPTVNVPSCGGNVISTSVVLSSIALLLVVGIIVKKKVTE